MRTEQNSRERSTAWNQAAHAREEQQGDGRCVPYHGKQLAVLAGGDADAEHQRRRQSVGVQHGAWAHAHGVGAGSGQRRLGHSGRDASRTAASRAASAVRPHTRRLTAEGTQVAAAPEKLSSTRQPRPSVAFAAACDRAACPHMLSIPRCGPTMCLPQHISTESVARYTVAHAYAVAPSALAWKPGCARAHGWRTGVGQSRGRRPSRHSRLLP